MIEKQTKITIKTISDMFKILSPNGNVPQEIDDAKLEDIAQKAADKAASKRHTQIEATTEILMNRIYNLVNGAIGQQYPRGYTSFSQSRFLPPEVPVKRSSLSSTKTQD